MLCSCCGKQKKNLRAVKSLAVPTMRFYACSSCREANLEPRHLLVLAQRSGVPGEAARLIREGLYIGNTILAEEVV